MGQRFGKKKVPPKEEKCENRTTCKHCGKRHTAPHKEIK